jgi:hypothetical protein
MTTTRVRRVLALLILAVGAIAGLAPAATAEPATADLAEHGAWLDANPAIAEAMANPVIPELPAKAASVARPDHPMSTVQPICNWINVSRYGPEPNSTYTMCEAWHIYGSHQAWMIFMGVTSGDWYCTIVDIYTGKTVNYGWNSC